MEIFCRYVEVDDTLEVQLLTTSSEHPHIITSGLRICSHCQLYYLCNWQSRKLYV